MNSSDFSTAIGYYTRALEQFRQIKDTVNSAYPLVNIAECYYLLGNLEQSREYVHQSLNVSVNTKEMSSNREGG
jgi:tetratricopeptide (TPR) repeat protein